MSCVALTDRSYEGSMNGDHLSHNKSFETNRHPGFRLMLISNSKAALARRRYCRHRFVKSALQTTTITASGSSRAISFTR